MQCVACLETHTNGNIDFIHCINQLPCKSFQTAYILVKINGQSYSMGDCNEKYITKDQNSICIAYYLNSGLLVPTFW